MAKKKKRRIRYDRLLLVLAAAALVIGAVWFAAAKLLTPAPKAKTDEPSKTSSAQSAVSPSSQTVHITAAGDILLEEAILGYFGNGSWNDYMSALDPYFKTDDATIANMEVPIGGEDLGITGIDFSFNAPAVTASNVWEQGIDIVSLANNHANDRGQQGIINTHNALDQAGILYTGTSASEEEARKILSTEINGLKIGIVSYTYNTNQPSEADWSVNIFESAYSDRSDALIEDIRKAKAENDAVIAAIHWGTEFIYQPDQNQILLAQAAADAGADVIIGNHPHCIQPAEWLTSSDGRRVLCFYSLGNLVSSAYQVSRADETFQNMYEVGAIASFDLSKENESIQIENPQIIPIVNHFEGDYSSFKLYLLKDYTEDLAAVHDQRSFSDLFTPDWLKQQVQSVFADPSIPVILN